MKNVPHALSPEILLTHGEFIRGLAQSLIHDEHRAEDVVQDVWVAALKKPREEVTSLRAWLGGTARNMVRRALRSEGRLRARERAAARPEAVRSTEELVEGESARRRVVDAVLRLKEPYRSAILFRFYDDLPPRRIARRLDVPVETVKTRIQRGLDQLRKALDAEYGGRRSAWCLPLASAAGLKLKASSAAAFTGALAMTVKMKIGIAAAAVAALFIGSLLIFWEPEGKDMERDSSVRHLTSRQAEEGEVAEGGDNLPAGKKLREPLFPNEDSSTMPASYRKALGGYRGRVVDSNGAPVPDRKVELCGFHIIDLFQGQNAYLDDEPPRLDLKRASAYTREDGVFLLNDVHPRAYNLLRVERDEDGFASRLIFAQPNPGETTDLGDVVLEACAALTGKVVDESGKPLGGVRIRAANLPDEIFAEGLHAFREGCSILYKWRLFVEMNFVIDPPPAFFQMLRMLAIPETVTASDGSFCLEGAPLGEVRLVADKPGFVTCAVGPVTRAKAGAHDLGTITLSGGISVKGRVLDRNGKPVQGVEVRAGAAHGTGDFCILHPPVHTDGEGIFKIDGVAPLPTLCAARLYKENVWTFFGPLDPGGENLTLHLPAALNLRVKVRQENGAPIKEARLRLRERSFQNVFPSHSPVKIDDRAERPEEGTILVKGLTPGMYELMITAEGYGTAVEGIELETESLLKTVVLKEAGWARLRVTTEEGSPLEWAEVFMGVDTSDWLEHGMEFSRGRTDREGRVSIQLPSPGKYRTIVSHPGYAVSFIFVEIPSGAETVVRMKPGGALEGKVHFPEGVLAPLHTVALESRSFEPFVGSSMPRLASLDGEGRFHVKNLNPGNYDVHLVTRLPGKNLFDHLKAFEFDRPPLGSVEVESGETSVVEFFLDAVGPQVPCGAVAGGVFIDGEPAEGAVVIMRFTTFKTAVDASGLFDLQLVPAGRNFMKITIPPGPGGAPEIKVEREVLVEEGVTHYENVEISTGSIFGRVVMQPEGSPVCGARVEAWIPAKQPDHLKSIMELQQMELEIEHVMGRITSNSPGYYKTSMEAITGVDGSFLFERVPEGIYNVKVRKKNIGTRPAADVEVVPGGATGPVVLEMYVPITVKGYVKLPEGAQNADGLGLTVYPAGQKPEGVFQGLQQIITGALLNEVGGTRWVKVDKATGAFEIPRMMPGSYTATFQIFSKNNAWQIDGMGFEAKNESLPAYKHGFRPMEFEVPSIGLTDLMLVPVPFTESEEKP